MAWLRARDMRIVALARRRHGAARRRRPHADRSRSSLGSEANGLSDAWRAPDIGAIRLPMLGVADSLNVSAAAAVLLYEAWRQRRAREPGATYG